MGRFLNRIVPKCGNVRCKRVAGRNYPFLSGYNFFTQVHINKEHNCISSYCMFWVAVPIRQHNTSYLKGQATKETGVGSKDSLCLTFLALSVNV